MGPKHASPPPPRNPEPSQAFSLFQFLFLRHTSAGLGVPNSAALDDAGDRLFSNVGAFREMLNSTVESIFGKWNSSCANSPKSLLSRGSRDVQGTGQSEGSGFVPQLPWKVSITRKLDRMEQKLDALQEAQSLLLEMELNKSLIIPTPPPENGASSADVDWGAYVESVDFSQHACSETQAPCAFEPTLPPNLVKNTMLSLLASSCQQHADEGHVFRFCNDGSTTLQVTVSSCGYATIDAAMSSFQTVRPAGPLQHLPEPEFASVPCKFSQAPSFVIGRTLPQHWLCCRRQSKLCRTDRSSVFSCTWQSFKFR